MREMTTANPSGVLEGVHFFNGDAAACEGALAAGARFAAGYPITPSTEIVERFSQRAPKVGGVFIQMEDELASSIAICGAAWAGAKAFTVTSGPGFSLMMEHVGYAAMTETPVVFINVQRGGPSTGLPTLPAQGDMMQARFGSHGDYGSIALCPSSPQECFELTIKAFNLAERFRTPTFVMMDECVGHMTEKVRIPPAEEIAIYPRRLTKKKPGELVLYDAGEDLVPEMAHAGQGHRVFVTGLTHDKRGYPVMNSQAQNALVFRLVEKIKKGLDELVDIDTEKLADADVVVVSYGITARVAQKAIAMAREKGLKVGKFRLRIVWPFPEKQLREVAGRVKAIVVPELNMGQVVLEVERSAAGQCKVISVPHAGGTVHKPEDILRAIEGGAR